MKISEGDVIKIDGKSYTVFHGPWRYMTRNGYGLYITFDDVERELDVWLRRIGVDVLETFGFIIEN